MGVTVQVRDLDPDVDDRLKRAAAERGLSYSEFLRRELTRIAERMRIDERWAALQTKNRLLRSEPPTTPFEPIPIDSETIVRWIREGREGR